MASPAKTPPASPAVARAPGDPSLAPHVRPASGPEAGRCCALLTLAFSGDPAARWVFPDPAGYASCFPDLVRALGGGAFQQGSAHVLEGFQGAALWLPPGAAPDEAALLEVIGRGVPEGRRGEVLDLFGEMEAHHPVEPHWYLPLIGVDPRHQRKGRGSVLLRHALAACDRSRHLAYLESSSPENTPLYERHGFKAVGSIRVGSAPVITPMVREPQVRGRRDPDSR